MDKAMKSLLIFCIVGIFSVELAEAQLINYQRRNKRNAPPPAAPAAPANKSYKMTEPAITKQAIDPIVQTKLERKYDANNDGVLQKAEVVAFLKDVIKGVEKSGSYPVNSEIIKKYDLDYDGSISKYEITEIVREVGK